MSKDFILIVITSPYRIKNEGNKIAELLNEGYDYVHIRKPDWTLGEVRTLIEEIPYRLRSRLKLHGHFELLSEMNLGGVHLNSRCKNAPSFCKSISKTCHTIEEIEGLKDGEFEYVTLSPIFDSISKQGYMGKFDLGSISNKIRGKNVIALGGVTPDKYEILKEKGFSGAALLGYIWEGSKRYC